MRVPIPTRISVSPLFVEAMDVARFLPILTYYRVSVEIRLLMAESRAIAGNSLAHQRGRVRCRQAMGVLRLRCCT